MKNRCYHSLQIAWPVVVLLCSATAAAEDVGFVLDVTREWVVEHKGSPPKVIAAGDSLQAGDVVYPQPPTDPESTLIVSLYSGELATFHERATLPERLDAGRLNQVWALVKGHYQGALIHAQSRGGSLLLKLHEAVVQKKGDRLDLTAVFESMPADDYQLAFQRLPAPADGAAQPASKTFKFSWDPNAKPTLEATGLTAGAYRVTLTDEDPSSDRDGPLAVVLIAREEDFAQQAAEFQTAQDMTKSWGSAVPGNCKRAFLRALLEAIAQRTAKSSN
jgi:hypothetical protein